MLLSFFIASSALGDFKKDDGALGGSNSDKSSLEKLSSQSRGDSSKDSKNSDDAKNGATALPNPTKDELNDSINKKNMAFGGSVGEGEKGAKKNSDPHL